MGLFKRKRKSIYVVTKRSKDDIPYVLPRITASIKSDNPLEIPVSPHFGSDVEETTELHKTNKTKIDVYDQFRKEPVNNKDKEIPYPEFRVIRSTKKKEETKPVEPVKEENTLKPPVVEETKPVNKPLEEINEPKETPSFFKYEETETTNTNDSSFIETTFMNKEETKPVEPVEEIKPVTNETYTSSFDYTEEETVEETETVENTEVEEEDNTINPFEVENDIQNETIEPTQPIINNTPPVIENIYQTQEEPKETMINRPVENKIDTHGYTMEEWAIINSGHKSPSYQNFKKPPLSLLD